MDKVKVEICCGTSCYLLGASELVDIELRLPPDIRGCVEITGRPCLELCERENIGQAPYVRFNENEIMCAATPEKVMARIIALAKEGGVSC